MSKNYLQHILGILIINKSLADICDLYNVPEEDFLEGRIKLNVVALTKSHTGADRGNLPLGITAADFYERVIEEMYQDRKALKDFARRLHKDLQRDNMFPAEWENQEKYISGFSAEFDEEIFFSYFVDLLKQDKDAKKNKLAPKQLSAHSPLEFSSKFFNEGALGIIDFDDGEFENELKRLSDVFRSIISTESKHEAITFESDENWIVSLKNRIKLCLDQTDNKDLLKIKGPLGSYKNRLMQYLYLAIARDLDFVTPIYIDIASYEKSAEETDGTDEKKFLEAFERDIEEAEEIISREPDKKHLLLLDGIRDFSCRNESLYYSINERIKSKDWYFIVCMDTDFTFNKRNKYDVHPLVSNNFECYLRLRSMTLNKKTESLAFIRNCVNMFNIKIPDTVSIEQIYDNLVRLNFLNIDAYWLKYLLQTHIHVITNSKTNISGLYNAISINFLGSYDSIDTAAQFAFEFEYGSKHIDTNPRFDLGWRLMKEHRSMFDFLIAKHYVKKVLSFDLKSEDDISGKNRFEIFNMVIQDNIGRFAFAMLAGNDDYEHLVMQLATHHYDNFKPIGKSELSFRITGVKNGRRHEEGISHIRLYLAKELEHFEKLSPANVAKKKDYAFLLRSLYINLIYNNDREAFFDYFKMLLSDKLANSINRGFHLEFYGDKFFIPNKSLLDFEDDVRKGYNTFNKLCLVLDTRIRNNDKAVYGVAIEIATLCHLIQARLEQTQASKVFDVKPYIPDCLRYLEWIVDRPQIKEFDDVVMYFNWMTNELKNLTEKGTNGSVRYLNIKTFIRYFQTCICVLQSLNIWQITRK